ncbi:MAG: hypothetical protein K5655_01110 [Lachnospiraceae bacterium]|nr:hypothetical protein [Lachnospiraceae bacterium]
MTELEQEQNQNVEGEGTIAGSDREAARLVEGLHGITAVRDVLPPPE